MLIIFLNFFYLNAFLNQDTLINEENYNENDYISNNLKASVDVSMLLNPFTQNLDIIREFFEKNYKSGLDFDISTFFRYGDTTGIITDDIIYSEDNILLYKSLFKSELTKTEIFDSYLKLQSTPLWYDGNGQYKYGFVKSISNSTGEIANDDRYLIDNLLPIFLLIENIGDDIDNINIQGKFPKDSIEEMFYLVNSSEFWDMNKKGFYNHNSTSSKYMESNFYGILANLLIHRTYHQLNLNNYVKNRAYYLANQTMNAIINFMWNPTDKAFYHNANLNWGTPLAGQKYYHLSVNALGIITLLEFWIETGMQNDSDYLLKAIQLYNSLNDKMWNSVNKVYYNIAQPSWVIFDNSYNLKANALMLRACLKLFEFTGNITYYNRAIEIFNSFETNFYDNINTAYDFSLTNSSKSLNSNLKLCEAYLKASEIYSSTVLNSEYNLTKEVPSFAFNQDVMNLTSVYSYKKVALFYNVSTDKYDSLTIWYNITDADIKYLFKYPNGTFLYQFDHQILSPATSHTLIHPIEETLPIKNGYFVYIWANTSYFGIAETIKRFNVFSGLINESVEGLVNILYQGPIVNITLPINYTRTDNLTLTASLEGENIVNFPSHQVNFTVSEEIIDVRFNLTARFGAIPGPSEIIFKIKKGNILYLQVREVIEIGYSFDYSNLIYQSKVVRGDNVYVSLNLINFLPNATQNLNISFTGVSENTIDSFIQEETLIEKEIKTVSYSLKTSETIKTRSIQIKMEILQNTTVYYKEVLSIELIPKYEIISASFPEISTQGANAYIIIIIKNNLHTAEEFSLFINGREVQTNINELVYGENRIVKSIVPTKNPYDFETKSYRLLLMDSADEEIVRFYFTVSLQLSTFNFVIFYLLPSIIPIGIILYFVSKEIKHKKLRR
ncbi:MAG: hypothetical protein ACFFEN_17175 [Candidatus Thorarchaeota archaeon]